MRSKLSVVLVVVMFAFSCSDDDDKAPSQEEMLTGNSTKSWKLSTNTEDADEDEETCKASSARNQDNRWKFTKGGYFEFDRGADAGDESCDVCCTDILNIFGTWQISGGKMIIMAEGELVDGTKVPWDHPEELMNETLKSLSSDKFEISFGPYIATFLPAN